ncbi:MAG: hypothetical protein ACLFN8_05045 [Candidatus Woesearchaeota archaeon]
MIHTKKIIILALMMLTFLITGCYQITIEQKIHSDGSGDLIIIYDFETLVEMLKQESDEPVILEDMVCTDMEDAELEEILINLKCETINEHTVKITGEFVEDTVKVQQIDDYYEYDIKEVYNIFDKMDGSSDNFTDEDITELTEEDELTIQGLNLTYIMIFEGDVIHTDIGVVDGNKVIINLLELPNTQNPKVRAKINEQGREKHIQITQTENEQETQQTQTELTQTENEDEITTPDQAPQINNENNNDTEQPQNDKNTNIVMYAIIGIILIILVALMILKNKKKQNDNQYNNNDQLKNFNKNQNENTQEITPKIKTLITWIKQYETQYPEKILREQLEKDPNYTQQEIDTAFRNK